MAEKENPNPDEQGSGEKLPVELSEEQLDAAIQKRFGVPPSELIRKADQIKVLTEDEKKEAEEKKRGDVVKYALENKIYTTVEHEQYIAAMQTDKVELLRKKYIADHPDDKRAAKTFDRLYRLDEDDDIEDGETTVPNEDKKAARAALEYLADLYIDQNYGKIKKAPERYERHVAEQDIFTKNTEMVTRAISELPKTFEVKTGRDTYNVPVTAEDLADANKMIAESGILKKKGIVAAEVKETIGLFLQGKKMQQIISEVEEVATKKAVEAMERGANGVDVVRSAGNNSLASSFEEFNKKHGIVPI